MAAGRGWRRLMLGLHGGLALAVAVSLARIELAWPVRAALIGLALAPLAATLPALVRVRGGGLSWLALALVAYAGFGSVEVIATGTAAAAAVLLLALLELGLALMLSRTARSRGRAAGGES